MGNFTIKVFIFLEPFFLLPACLWPGSHIHISNMHVITYELPKLATDFIIFQNQQIVLTSILVELQLTVDELARVEEKIGHEDPVDHHGADERHHGKDQTGPLAKLPKVILANVGELPVCGVHVGWTTEAKTARQIVQAVRRRF